MGKAFGVLVGVVVLGVGSAGAIKFGLGRTAEEIQQSPGFAAGWAKAERHPALLEAIGPARLAPFSLKEFVTGGQRWDFTAAVTETMETNGNAMRSIRSERNEIEVPIQGEKGTAQLTIHAAEKPGAGWEVTRLEAKVPGQGTPIDLLGSPPKR